MSIMYRPNDRHWRGRTNGKFQIGNERAFACVCVRRVNYPGQTKIEPGRAGPGQDGPGSVSPCRVYLAVQRKRKESLAGSCVLTLKYVSVCVCMLKKRFWLSSPTSVRWPVSRPALLNAREKELECCSPNNNNTAKMRKLGQ